MTLLLFLAGAGTSTPTPPTPGTITPVTHIAGYQPNQLTLAIFTPAYGTFSPRSVFEGKYQRAVNSFQFEKGVNGGYLGASFSFVDRKNNILDWFENGLGRHVEVYNPRQRVIYAGFVNKVRIGFGALSADRGPLMEITNRASLIYTPLDTSVFPPVQGITRPTTITNNTASQAKYGIIERSLSGGTITDADAAQIQATYLEENAFPETNNAELLLGSGGNLTITIECVGYVERLKTYIYNQIASSSSVTITSKIQTVLGADPNGIISTDYSKIATNNYLVNSYEGENRDALTIISGMLAIGDINDTRYTFGVYANQQAVYAAIPSETTYQERLSAKRQQVETLEGEYLYPWDVEPGNFLLYTDFQIGRLSLDAARANPNLMFLEAMTYTAPWGLRLTGGKFDKLPQKLAKLGLGGI